MNSFVRGNIELLKQAQGLIDELSDAQYQNNDLPPFNSGIGKHLRHVLDFYAAFLNRQDNRINYDQRGRDAAVETQPAEALARIEQISEALAQINGFDAKVWSKNDEAVNAPNDQRYNPSTIGRELQFLVNHTVHHFAMIALLLYRQGVATPPGFGVALSTLAHWRRSGKEPAS